MMFVAEDYNDYGSYRKYLEDEEFKSRPIIRKIFSWRGFKFGIKLLAYLVVIGIFALLLWRIFSSKNPQKASDLIWTQRSYAAYKEYGSDLLMYTQDLKKVFEEDGKFSIYELRYIPASSEIQFTIRYNKSTLDTLAEELTENKRKELGDAFTEADIITVNKLPEMPFVFALRDDQGNAYTESEYTTFTKGRYTYLRIAFSGVDLFDVEKQTPSSYFPTPDVENSSYIYKGRFSPDYTKEAIKSLYLDSYYVGDTTKTESFSEKVTLYSTSRQTTVYDYSSELPKGATADLAYASAKPEE